MPGAVPAPMGKRLLAFVIDQVAGLLLGGAFVVSGLLEMLRAARDTSTTGEPVSPDTTLLVLGSVVLLGLGLFQWWYQGARGFTVGKRLVGLRTLSAGTGRPIGLGRALVRLVVPAAGSLVLGVGQLVVYASPLFDQSGRRRGWHDKAADSMVFDVAVGRDPSTAQSPSAPDAAHRLGALLGERALVSVGGPATAAPAALAPAAAAPLAAAPLAPVALNRAALDPVEAHPVLVTAAHDLSREPARVSAGHSSPSRLSAGSSAAAEQVRPGIIVAVPGVRQPAAPEPGTEVGVPHPQLPRGPVPTLRHAKPPEPASEPAPPPAPEPARPAPVPPVPPVQPERPAPVEPTRPVTVDPAPKEPVGGGLADDVERTRLRPARAKVPEVPAGSAQPTVAIDLTDGRRIELTGTALVGRRPAPRPDDGPVQLITVADPGRSVSKTHLAIGVDRVGVWIRDRDSTNGTVVTLADGQQILCAAEQQVRVPFGASVAFGDYGLTLAHEPAPARPHAG